MSTLPTTSSQSNLDPPAEATAEEVSPSSKNEVLIRVKNVSKIFCRDFKKSLKYGLVDSFKDLISPINSPKKGTGEDPRSLRSGEFYAIQNVNFELRRGECLALIGYNGAGKTTLLKMINGLIKPDNGRIEMKGRIGALIALGAGFNPLLTGRENIYVNGSVLGYTSKEIDAKFSDILSFAEIDDFIDAPVQSYSSGMKVRLGFAIASVIDPDILLIDEVLAVGDARFRMKCFERIRKLQREGVGIILVSHNPVDLRRICNKGLLLKQGEVDLAGSLGEVLAKYEQEGADQPLPEKEIANLKIFNVSIMGINGCPKEVFNHGDRLVISFSVRATDSVGPFRLFFRIDSQRGEKICGDSSIRQGRLFSTNPNDTLDVELVLPEIPFIEGYYSLYIAAFEGASETFLGERYLPLLFQVETPKIDHFGSGCVGQILVNHEWIEK